MLYHTNRRSFLSGLLFISLSPLAAGKPSRSKTFNHNHQQTLNKIQPLDRDYVSINGWVLAKHTLTQGIR